MTDAQSAPNAATLRLEIDQLVEQANNDCCDLDNLSAALQVCIYELESVTALVDHRARRLRAALIGICDAIELKADCASNATSSLEDVWGRFKRIGMSF